MKAGVRHSTDWATQVPQGMNHCYSFNIYIFQYIFLKENIKKVEEINENLKDSLHCNQALLQAEREKNIKNVDMVRVRCQLSYNVAWEAFDSLGEVSAAYSCAVDAVEGGRLGTATPTEQ